MYNWFLKPFLFFFYPEVSHHLALRLFRFLLAIPGLSHLTKAYYSTDKLNKKIELFGLEFKNALGLAAGFDKDGKYLELMSAMGFGFLEIGTVTPKPQLGNPKPRLFRLTKDKALINRMGFNNDGVDALVGRLRHFDKGDVIIGGNIGKNKSTPNEDAYKDYLYCFERLHEYVDYFVVNVSSPNTPGLRDLQQTSALRKILEPLVNHHFQEKTRRPILLKIAPDLIDESIGDILDLLVDLKMDGIIATNTTISRADLQSDHSEIESIGAGGLSGAPLQDRSTEVISYINERTKNKLPIIGVGGILKAEDAREKLDKGASLVQVYSGFIYEGPAMIKNILRGI